MKHGNRENIAEQERRLIRTERALKVATDALTYISQSIRPHESSTALEALGSHE